MTARIPIPSASLMAASDSYFHVRKRMEDTVGWMVEKQLAGDWKLLMVTVAFKGLTLPDVSSNMRERTLAEYRRRVLPKIQKRLCRDPAKRHLAMPVDLVQYEYSQGSRFKPIPTAASPHHVHGLIAVAADRLARIYDITESCPVTPLSNDIRSVRTVIDFHLKPIDGEEVSRWFLYMLKGKNVGDLTY